MKTLSAPPNIHRLTSVLPRACVFHLAEYRRQVGSQKLSQIKLALICYIIGSRYINKSNLWIKVWMTIVPILLGIGSINFVYFDAKICGGLAVLGLVKNLTKHGRLLCLSLIFRIFQDYSPYFPSVLSLFILSSPVWKF